MKAVAKINNFFQVDDHYCFAPSFPGLSVFGLLPRFLIKKVFPFNEPNALYFENARSCIYHLVKILNLEGKEILFPSYCCGIDLEAVLTAGANPKIYPLYQGMKINLQEIASKIGPNTKAVYVIHYFGFPGPIEDLAKICKERNLLLIEDCALSLFSNSNDRPLGSFGDAAVFSIYKTLPVPSGGVLIVKGNYQLTISRRSPPILATISALLDIMQQNVYATSSQLGKTLFLKAKTFGQKIKRTTTTSDEKKNETMEVGFDIEATGNSISKISRWLINSQNPNYIVDTRRKNFLYLQDRLKQIAKPVFSELPDKVCPLFYPIIVDDSMKARNLLRIKGVHTVAWWRPTHSYLNGKVNRDADTMRQCILAVPCHQSLSLKTLDKISKEVSDLIKSYGQ